MDAVTTATKLTQAGLGRQAAATAAGELVGVLDDVLVDVRTGVDEALGSTTMAVSDSSLKMYSTPDIDALLHGGGGQGLGDALGAVDSVLSEARALAGIAGDASMERVLRNASDRTKLAQAQVQFALRSAVAKVDDPAAATAWESIDGTFSKYAIANAHRNSQHLATHVREVLGEVERTVATTRSLAAGANERISDFGAVHDIATAARTASATGETAPAKVAPLVRAAEDLIKHAAALHEEQLPKTLQVADELTIQIDALALDRHLSTSTIAIGESRALLQEAAAVLEDAGGTHPDLRELLRTASGKVDSLVQSGDRYNPHTPSILGQQKLRDRLLDSGTSRADLTGTLNGGTMLNLNGTQERQLDMYGMFREGLFKSKVTKDVLRDPTPVFSRVFAISSADSIAALATLHSRVDAEATGTAARSMLGTGTLSAVQDALAATRARFGSASELQDALATARAGG